MVADLEQVDRLGDIDMEPMDLLGTTDADSFDLFAEIEKYETSNTSTNGSLENSWESSVGVPVPVPVPVPVTPSSGSVQQVRSSVIVGRPPPPPQPQSPPKQVQLPAGSSKTAKILPGVY